MPIKTVDERTEEILKANKANENADVAASDALYDNKIKTTNDTYSTQIKDTEDSYVNAFKSNETQRFLNERAITRRAAELGLTDSGMNRTGQLAVQLSYANQKGELQRQKQKAIDTLAAAMSSEVSALNAEKLSAAQGIRSSYAESARSQANELYKADVEAETEKIKAEIEAAQNTASEQEASYIIKANDGLLSRDFKGTLAENGVSVYRNIDGNFVYVDNNSGKKTILLAGQNPYTGKTHEDLLDKNGVYDASRAFDNGYQPKYIGETELKAAKLSNGQTATYPVSGNQQTIWKANGKFYLWNGRINDYEELPEDETDGLY